jgi:DNA invertase Pin-like site-specific DNA recombinase
VLQEQLLREVWRLGAQVFSTSDAENDLLHDDPADPARRLVRQILGAVSEYERSVIALRLRSGRRRKLAHGGYGGGEPVYGLRAEAGELVPDEHEQSTIRRVLELHGEGRSYREIIEVLDHDGHKPKRGDRWHPTTIARIVKRHGGV